MPSTGGPIQELNLETSPYNPVYYPYEQFQDKLWHSIYPQGTGSFLQFNITWNPDQMILPGVSLEDFTLHSMMFYASPTDSRLQ